LEGDLIRVPTIDQLDAGGSELIAHRRIHVRIAAGYPVARRAREEREAAHESAADAEDVEMHWHADFIGLSASGARLALPRRFRLSSTPYRNIGKPIKENHHALL
jgi:hypothetical protein